MEIKTIFKATHCCFGTVHMCFGTTGLQGHDETFRKHTDTYLKITTDGCYPIEVIAANRNFGSDFPDINTVKRQPESDYILLKFNGAEGYLTLLQCFRTIVKQAEMAGYLEEEEDVLKIKRLQSALDDARDEIRRLEKPFHQIKRMQELKAMNDR